MRTTLLLASLVGVLVASALVGADSGLDAAEGLAEGLSLDLAATDGLLEKDGDGPAGHTGSTGNEASAGTATLSAVVAPVATVGKTLVDLGLQLLGGFFQGISEGASTFGAAAATLAKAPATSAGVAAGTLGVLGLLSMLAVALQRYGSLGAIPLFSRITKDALLENKTRNEIFELIRASPGVNVSEISRRLDVAWGTATHHLQKLREERLVGVRVVGHQKCFFLNGGTYTPHEMDMLSATKSPTAHRIAQFLVENGATAHQGVSNGLGLSPALVSFHMRKLLDAGIVSRQRDGRRTIYAPLESTLVPTPRPMVHGI